MDGERLLRIFNWVTVLLILVLAFACRLLFNPDLISYLDVGDAWLRGDLANAPNGYWSPILPILVSSAASLFPNNEWDSTASHFVYALLHLGALWAFNWLLRQIDEFISGATNEQKAISRALVLTAFPIFLWCDLILTSLKWITADILIDICLLCSSGIILRIVNRGSTLKRFAALGLVLGLGYLSKAIMLSIGVVFLGSTIFLTRFSLRQLRHGIVAFLIMLAINVPNIALVSKKMGRLDLGDTGPLAYAWYVNDIAPLFHWMGGPPGFGVAKNPPTRVLDSPEVFDFSRYPHGSYPPGFDPAYWNEGLKPKFIWADQWRRLKLSGKLLIKMHLQPACLAFGAALLICFAKTDRREFLKNFRWTLPLAITAAAGIAAYVLILLSDRYIAYFLLLGFVSILIPMLKSLRGELPKPAAALCWLSVLFVLMSAGRHLLDGTVLPTSQIYREHRQVAQTLKSHGLKPGERIAILGVACEASYARIADVQIMAEGCTFHDSVAWLDDAEKRERAVAAIKPLGLRAIVLEAAPANLDTKQWIRVGDTKYSILFLQ